MERKPSDMMNRSFIKEYNDMKTKCSVQWEAVMAELSRLILLEKTANVFWIFHTAHIRKSALGIC